MSRILGIDYGRARVGLAISAGTLGEPLEVTAPELAGTRAAAIVDEYGVTALVVGVSEKEMAEESKIFGTKLAEKLGLPVTFTDETLSSVEVQQRLRSARQGKQQYRGPIDHFAAAIILERYLEDHPEGAL
jgi:putative Holliday junction resolvase